MPRLDDDDIQPAPVELGVLSVNTDLTKAAGPTERTARRVERENARQHPQDEDGCDNGLRSHGAPGARKQHQCRAVPRQQSGLPSLRKRVVGIGLHECIVAHSHSTVRLLTRSSDGLWLMPSTTLTQRDQIADPVATDRAGIHGTSAARMRHTFTSSWENRATWTRFLRPPNVRSPHRGSACTYKPSHSLNPGFTVAR